MTRFGPASGVAVVEYEGAVYVAELPDGPIAVLDGVAAVIWTEACAGDRETVAERVAAALEPPAEGIARRHRRVRRHPGGPRPAGGAVAA